MGDGISILAAGNFNLTFGNYRTGQRRAHQIHAFINRVGLNSGPHVISDELLTQILDVEFRSPGRFRLFFQAFHLRTLPHVGAVADHFALILLPQPAQHDRSIKSAGVRENDFFDLLSHFVIKSVSCQ